jgi:hypothetical protein
MELSKELKAIRAHDMQPGLSSVNMGLINTCMKKIKLIGSAAQIISLLKGQNIVPYGGLEVAAGDLGIDENLLEKVLYELQEVEFVNVIKKSGLIYRIEESIPFLKDAYSVLGERLGMIGLGEIENASLHILDDLSLVPLPAVEIKNKYDLDDAAFSIIKDIGINTGFLDEYTNPSNGQNIFYSPLYWEENPKKFFELIDRHGSLNLIDHLKTLRNQQGCPIELVDNPIIQEAIDLGCLPTPTVTSSAGEKAFAFSPIIGVGKYEKSLLTKARAIVACLRYGEHFGTITRIRNPELFLQRVLENRGTSRSHSEIPQQWELARRLGIGFFDKDTYFTNRYYFRLHENPENFRVFELAIQMVTFGDSERPQIDEEEARILLPGTFVHPSITRLRVKREGSYSRDNIILINDLIRGVSSDVF